MKRLIVIASMVLMATACTKTSVSTTKETMQFREWLATNCQYHVVEQSTGTIVFDAMQVKMDDKVISQRGLYYFLENTRPDLVFPVMKEQGPNGYTREISIGTSNAWCSNYRSQQATVKVIAYAGNKTMSWENCPVLLLQHETLPTNVKWSVATPKTLEIVLYPAIK